MESIVDILEAFSVCGYENPDIRIATNDLAKWFVGSHTLYGYGTLADRFIAICQQTGFAPELIADMEAEGKIPPPRSPGSNGSPSGDKYYYD
jgi:hypothetical protein